MHRKGLISFANYPFRGINQKFGNRRLTVKGNNHQQNEEYINLLWIWVMILIFLFPLQFWSFGKNTGNPRLIPKRFVSAWYKMQLTLQDIMILLCHAVVVTSACMSLHALTTLQLYHSIIPMRQKVLLHFSPLK